ncbi:MAG: RtcB family protein [bacterium]
MEQPSPIEFERLDEYRVRIPRVGPMRADGMIIADEATFRLVEKDQSPQQVANVACLPGLVGCSLAMPDIHWGYGFPIGGVAAFDVDDGVVSPGGVGYDINCGVRLLRTSLTEDEVRPRLKTLVDRLFALIPTGVGSSRRDLKLDRDELEELLKGGAGWAVERGLGRPEDAEHLESGGCLEDADPGEMSDRALERGLDQVGTLGSGNHFAEVGVVDEVYDDAAAEAFGLEEGRVSFLIHTGSRGLGYQIADDYMKEMQGAMRRYDIELPDKQLVCVPISSEEGQRYLRAMRAGANFAFANRQMITHKAREAFRDSLDVSEDGLGMDVVYDVCHNIAKIEEHIWEGEARKVCVHRKGATRAFPARHPEVPGAYREVGQPVLIPGDMGRYSFVLVGTEQAMEETWGSSCHGAGRVKSRTRSKKDMRGRDIAAELAEKGIYVRADSTRVLAEEVSEAYKDVADVTTVVEKAGIARRVARLRPMGNIKG